MSLREKTNSLFNAAGSSNTTPAKMKSMIDGLKSEPEFADTGALLTALQGALHVALMPIEDADSERRFGVIKEIADAEAGYYGGEYFPTILIQAVCRNNPAYIIKRIIDDAVVRTLIYAGADVDVANKHGHTALMCAAQDNTNPAIVSDLFMAGADVNHQDKEERSALMWAAGSNPNPKITRLLINFGANVYAKSFDGATALVHADFDDTNPQRTREIKSYILRAMK